MRINNTLREQLEDSHRTNEALTADLQKLTNDWEDLREEMMLKEEEWKDEEHAFNEYYSTEHNRLLNLWRDVVSMKRLFLDVQSSTERDMSKLKSEIEGFGRDMSFACTRMDRNASMDSLSIIGKDKYQCDQETAELKAQIDIMKLQHETCQSDLRMKEDRIQQLLKDVHNLVNSSILFCLFVILSLYTLTLCTSFTNLKKFFASVSFKPPVYFFRKKDVQKQNTI